MSGDPRGTFLLALARDAIAVELDGLPAPESPEPGWLDEPGAVFVTLRVDGRLRGCIGSLEARRSLRDDVCANARGAAFHDPRFPPLSREEQPGVVIEVSELSNPEPLEVTTEAEAHAALVPHRDGVILAFGARRATFLPQVWKQLPEPADFLASLKHKAGLPRAFWDRDLRLWRYTVTTWR